MHNLTANYFIPLAPGIPATMIGENLFFWIIP